MHRFLKTLSIICFLCGIVNFVFAQTPQPQDIVNWLHDNDMTIYTSLDEYRPEDLISRWESAKMITKYAESLNLAKNYSGSCEFTDTSGYDDTLLPFITASCEYGLLKWWNKFFTPTGTLTQAQALVIIERARNGFKDETWTPWYREYFQEVLTLWIVSTDQILSVSTTPITRFELGVWLYRASLEAQTPTDTTVYIPQWAVPLPPVIIQWSTTTQASPSTTNTAPSTNQPKTILKPSALRSSRDETAIEWSYMRNFNYNTYRPYTDTTAQTELAAWKRVAVVFASQSSLQSRTLDSNIKKWVWWNVTILLADFDSSQALRNQYWVTQKHTVVYLDSNGTALFKTVWKDVSVQQIIMNFDNGWEKGSNSRI